MADLLPLDFLNGILSLIVVSISLYVGIHIIVKYFKLKNRVFLYVGLVGIITSEPWWPHVISFFMTLINQTNLDSTSYFLIGTLLIPIAIFLWILALIDLVYKKYKKGLIIFGVIYLIVYEILLISMLLIDPTLIGQQIGAIDVQYSQMMLVLLISALGIILPTGLHFSIISLRSDKADVKMKGRFLALAFITYCTGAAIDSLILSNPANLIIARILLVLAAIGFLGGFVPPIWMKKLFLQQENEE